MAVRYTARTMGWSTRAVIAVGVLAVLLIAAVPAAFLVGLIIMLLGHVVLGLAVFGASILAAIAGVIVASLSGVRHLRKMISQQRERFKVMQLQHDDYSYE